MTTKSALRELNDAVLDLQSSDYNTYQRPLKRIWSTLSSTDLKPFIDALVKQVDFEAFVDSANTGGSMLGSASLGWPTVREEELGLAAALIAKGADDPNWFLDFAHNFYYAGSKHIACIRKITSSVIIPFSRDFSDYVRDEQSMFSLGAELETDNTKVFIVHGHDEGPRETLARFISSIGLVPVILHEQPNLGMTIPEKLVSNSGVGFAVVLLTPDDVGRAKPDEKEQPRARQNVVLELGYFIGKLGRERVVALLKNAVEIPSDFLGVVYTKFDDGGGWKQELARELQAVGYDIDWNKVML